MRWVIDAIEEGMASVELEDGTMLSLPVAALPRGAKAGDVVAIEIDREATRQALLDSAKQVSSIQRKSKRRDPGGDISL